MKRAIVLVGPQGSGKSPLGGLLENAPGVGFVGVEPLFDLLQAVPGYRR